MWAGRWNLDHDRWQLGTTIIGLTITLSLLFSGLWLAEKYPMSRNIGAIIISIAIGFFRLWMVLAWVVFIRRTRNFLIEPNEANEIRQMTIASRINAGVTNTIATACTLFFYVGSLRFGPAHLVILGVRYSCRTTEKAILTIQITSIGSSLHELLANLWLTWTQRMRLMMVWSGIRTAMIQWAILPQPDQEDIELAPTDISWS